MNAEILAVGHELLMGEIVDTNSSFIAQQLAGSGITVRWMSHVGDDIDDLGEAFARGMARSDIVISTGGLGPTSDDLSREAVARALGEEMTVDPGTLRWLEGVFAERGIEMPPTNIKQATLIPSAASIPNPGGTAPGWWVEKDGRHVVLLPGPPREIRRIWEATVGPRLAQLSGAGVISTRTLKTYGLTEGGMDELLSDLFGRDNPYLGIYAHTDGIHLRMIGRGPDEAAATQAIKPVETEIRARLGDVIWGADDDTPAKRLAALMARRGETLAVVEGASAGAVASMLYARPEHAAFLRGALVPGTGPVHPGHEPVAIEPDGAVTLANLARTSLRADIGLAITASSVDNVEVEAGTIFIGMASASGSQVAKIRYPRRSPEWVMQRSATMALIELVGALTAGRV